MLPTPDENTIRLALQQPGVKASIDRWIAMFLYDFGDAVPHMPALMAGAAYMAGVGFAGAASGELADLVDHIDVSTPIGQEIKQTALQVMEKAGIAGNARYLRLAGAYLVAVNAGIAAQQAAGRDNQV